MYNVYVIQSNDTYKIGVTTFDVAQRLEQINATNPHENTVILSASAQSKAAMLNWESGLHLKFKNKNIRYEWFNLDNKDLEFLEKLFSKDIETISSKKEIYEHLSLTASKPTINKTTITVTKDAAKEIKIRAAEEFMTMSDYVDHMLNQLGSK